MSKYLDLKNMDLIATKYLDPSPQVVKMLYVKVSVLKFKKHYFQQVEK